MAGKKNSLGRQGIDNRVAAKTSEVLYSDKGCSVTLAGILLKRSKTSAVVKRSWSRTTGAFWINCRAIHANPWHMANPIASSMATGNIVTWMGGNALRDMEENCHNLVKDCCSSGKNGITLNKMAQKWTDEGSSKNIRIDIRRDRNQVKSSAGGHRPSKYIKRSRGVKVVQQSKIIIIKSGQVDPVVQIYPGGDRQEKVQ
nr:uncharacterized protein LOC122321820 [Drosophila bipectinata]XP_043068727.1 uncharacterized protein LOC122321821 [Drosophila bipectinata]XP_043069610.1 uncharacterized protein LOC122322189 [Drosophila bipectinata]